LSKIEIRPHPKHKNLYISGVNENLKLYTRNLVPSKRVYGERLVYIENIEYREWDPYRSKLAAILLEKTNLEIFTENLKCLYLGASSGTTISHLSDLAFDGIIYGVEFAERSIRQLLQAIKERANIIPILGDANYPESYGKAIFSSVDLVYQDVAQPNQAEIAVLNCDYYLKRGGYLVLAIKSQSIDSIQKSKIIYEQERKIIEESGFKLMENINIHKYAANHLVLTAQKLK
jgi:fibrillarin-like pre-rRNA processing protein